MQLGDTNQSSKQAYNDSWRTLNNHDEYVQGSKAKVREHAGPCAKFKQRRSC